MFTGIIEGVGRIVQIIQTGEGRRLGVDANFDLNRTKIGDSIAVNGACLTVVKIDASRFVVDVSPETLNKTTLQFAKIGDRVNLERALRLSDRIDGHLVTGHVDGIAIIKTKKKVSNSVVIAFETSHLLSYHMIPKGSVAVDGISLTINTCDKGGFEVAIIPHTAYMTTIDLKQTGDKANIETDLIGKYIDKYVSQKRDSESSQATSPLIDQEYLIKTGFI